MKQERRLKDQRVFHVLLRHFFRQFFVSESIPLGTEGYKTTIQLLAILTAPGLFIPLYWLLPIYSGLQNLPVETQVSIVRYHQFFFITLSMAISCAVALLQWDRLFLTEKDRSILLVLPVAGRALNVSKLAALIASVGTFALAVNFFSLILFPGVVFLRGGVFITGTEARFFLGHAAGVLGGALFVFFLVVVVQGILLSVLTKRPKKFLGFIQLGFLIVLTLGLSLYSEIFRSWELISGSLSLGHTLFPPFWYLGLAQTIAGASEEVLLTLGYFGCWGLALAFGGTVALQLLVRYPPCDTAEQSPQVGQQRWARVLWARSWLVDPAQRAVVYFVGVTLLRSPRHRMIMTGFLGMGLGLALATWLAEAASSGALEGGQSLMAIPQILTFCMVVGMRVAFAEPAELGASWLFRLVCTSHASRYLPGVRTLMIGAVAGLLSIVFPMFVYFRGPLVAVLQMWFSLLLALILIEVVLFEFHRIPFTTSYLPGRANLKLWWAFYLFCFSTYAFSTAALGYWVLVEPVRAVVFNSVISALLFLWIRFRQVRFDTRATLVFEPEDRDQLVVLSLS